LNQKYKVTANIVWDFESELDHQSAVEKMRQEVSSLVQPLLPNKIGIRLDKHKSRKTIVLGEFDPDDVLPFVTSSAKRREYKIKNKSYQIRMNSHRYFVFHTNRNCVACGTEGTKMLLEQHPHDKTPHFNLYSEEDGKLILMTKDHIVAKSVGGEDRLSNYQTMCCICNNIKGSDPLTLEDIRHLRSVYNQHKNKLTRKKINARIRAERAKITFCDNKEEVSKKHFISKCDLLILQNEFGDLEAMSAYESIDKINCRVVACVKKGAKLQPISIEKKRLCIKFNDRSYFLFIGYVDCPKG